MLNNVLKIGICALCVYFISNEENKVSADKVNSNKYNAIVSSDNLENETDEEVVEVSNVKTSPLSEAKKSEITEKYLNLTNELKQKDILKSDSKLLDIEFIGDEIILNVNDNFLYIGGTYAEREVLNEFIKIGLSYDTIKFVTILVNNRVSETSEGIDTYRLNKLFTLD